METIENIEKAIDKIIAIVSVQLDSLKEIKLLLSSEALKNINISNNIVMPNFKAVMSTSGGDKLNMELYKDYPMNESFPKKMEFIDKIHPQAWRLKERRKLITAIEGPEKSAVTLDGVSGKLQNLWKSGKWDGAKYGGVNKYTFYARKEWLSEDGKAIRPEYAPPAEMLADLDEEQRKSENIKWLRK